MSKCAALKNELSKQPEPQIVPIRTFFDGNEDLGSIGCNLAEHPGLEKFYAILGGLLERTDVRGVARRQLSMYVPAAEGARLESLRQELDPVQAALIPTLVYHLRPGRHRRVASIFIPLLKGTGVERDTSACRLL